MLCRSQVSGLRLMQIALILIPEGSASVEGEFGAIIRLPIARLELPSCYVSDQSHEGHHFQKYFQYSFPDGVSPVFFQPNGFEVHALFKRHPPVLKVDLYHHISFPALAVYFDQVDSLWYDRHAVVIAKTLGDYVCVGLDAHDVLGSVVSEELGGFAV